MRSPQRRALRLLGELTRRYYSETSVYLPYDYPFREFAAQLWGSRSYIRHMSFANKGEVQRFLVSKAPKHFYYSSARYDQPGVDDMDAKGWRSSDIVFDIDADHLPGCEESLVRTESIFGDEASFIEERCIVEAARHTVSLYDILVEELGFRKDSLQVEFSGHRGFHVTVYLRDTDEEARLGQDYRRELVNYVQAVGLQEEVLEPWRALGRRRRSIQPVPPLVTMAGYRGRLARTALRLARGSPLARVFTSTPVEAARLYAENREKVDKLLETARRYASPVVDAQVTVDTRRLIRAPLSLNGKTMLPVKPLAISSLDEFRVSEDLSPFSRLGELRVEILVTSPSPVEVLGHRLRLRRGERPRLAYPVALYLVAKGAAAPLEGPGVGVN